MHCIRKNRKDFDACLEALLAFRILHPALTQKIDVSDSRAVTGYASCIGVGNGGHQGQVPPFGNDSVPCAPPLTKLRWLSPDGNTTVYSGKCIYTSSRPYTGESELADN